MVDEVSSTPSTRAAVNPTETSHLSSTGAFEFQDVMFLIAICLQPTCIGKHLVPPVKILQPSLEGLTDEDTTCNTKMIFWWKRTNLADVTKVLSVGAQNKSCQCSFFLRVKASPEHYTAYL